MATEKEDSSESTAALEAGPFVLRSLVDKVPLSADGTEEDIKINCVDYYDGNLYVGTSASELLHFVQIPPDPADETGTSSFILASRLRPQFTESTIATNTHPGVQQIVLLPPVGKACVLCNWTVTFYSLPELSPVFREVKNCNWIGGVDLSEESASASSPKVTVLLSLNRRLQVVSIGDSPRAVKNIEFAASILSARRDAIACVADARSYALVHVEHQLKIPLMSISSLDELQPGTAVGQVQNLQVTAAEGGHSRSSSAAQGHSRTGSSMSTMSHNRSTSLGGLMTGAQRGAERSPQSKDSDDTATTPPTNAAEAPAVAVEEPGQAAQPPPVPSPQRATTPVPVKPTVGALKPLIASPTPDEFLLVTGTAPSEPGIGMFVNLDGDPTRPTLEFDRYPDQVVVDGGQEDLSSSRLSLRAPGDSVDEGYVLASMSKDFPDGTHYGLEIQRWDINTGEDEADKFWLETPGQEHSLPVGIRSLIGNQESQVREVINKLCQRKVTLPEKPDREEEHGHEEGEKNTKGRGKNKGKSKHGSPHKGKTAVSHPPTPEADDDEIRRNKAEEEFVSRLANTNSRIAVWSGDSIWWAVRNPLVLQLEAGLSVSSLEGKIAPATAEERRGLFTVLGSFRGNDAKNELEFVTFSYIRQRAGILLFASLLQSSGDNAFSEPESKALEEVLLDSGLDPRIVLALVPGLRDEIIQSPRGTWIFGGVKETVERYLASDEATHVGHTVVSLGPKVLSFLRRFLIAWRRKKGFGSVADESEVFRTVDASLISVLLELDKNSPKGILVARTGSVRGDLNDVVDKGVDCFDRAVELLESRHRLFVLSRLYQSRKMAGDVLATWKRIIEGERDDGGELQDGEQRVREYLAKISHQPLVQEYGLWLANRNPRLGVQVFADDKARAPKFEPTQVVPLLRKEAPAAVKYYLEYLVFSKGHSDYVDELIMYYLDIVTSDLRSSKATRDTILASYEAYRALQPPKPSFHRFLADNMPPGDELWQSRLRLLELLGGPHPYEVAAVRSRLTEALPADHPAEQLLVPETIILNGREHRHEDALRLLVHGLGDYDTAVAYCLHGGSSLYNKVRVPSSRSATSGSAAAAAPKRRESLPPTVEVQAKLFRALLLEFLALQDVSDRIEQTSGLLSRFAGWFDVMDVLSLLPDAWAVEIASGFLVHALRELVRDRNETTIARALSGAENLRVHDELIAKTDEQGPQIEAEN